MKETLISYGFTKTGGCSCGGTLSYTFTRAVNSVKHKVIIKPNRGKFLYYTSNQLQVTATESELEKTLQNYGLIKTNN